MKRWIATFAVFVLAGAAVQADVLGLKNWTYDGSLEVKGNQADNETDADDGTKDSRGNTITRLRLGIGMDILDDVKGRVELTRSGGNVSQYGDASRPSSVDTETASILFQNAYIDLMDFIYIDKVRLGRQYVGRKDDLLVYLAPVDDDAMSIRSLDALVLDKKVGPVQINFVTGKTREDDGVPGSGTATDSNGVGEMNITYGTLMSDELVDLGENKLPLEIGYYQGTAANTGSTPSDNDNLTILDLRVGFMGLGSRLSLLGEYSMNGGQFNTGAGTKTDYKGNALLLKAAWDDKELGYGAKLMYANASGDDNAGNTEDKSFHDYSTLDGNQVSDLRFGEIISNSNSNALQLVGLDTGFEGPGLNALTLGGYYVLPVLEEKIKLMADYYMVKVNEVVSGADDGYGNELDLAVKYKHSDNVHASVGYAMFTPDTGYVNGFTATAPGLPEDDITKLWAKLTLRWGGLQAY